MPCEPFGLQVEGTEGADRQMQQCWRRRFRDLTLPSDACSMPRATSVEGVASSGALMETNRPK
jgi:hypothetical protein